MDISITQKVRRKLRRLQSDNGLNIPVDSIPKGLRTKAKVNLLFLTRHSHTHTKRNVVLTVVGVVRGINRADKTIRLAAS